MTFGEPMFPSGRRGDDGADDLFDSPGDHGFDDPFGLGADDSPFEQEIPPATAGREVGGRFPKVLALLTIAILAVAVSLILPVGQEVATDATRGFLLALAAYVVVAVADTAEQRARNRHGRRGRLVWVALLRPTSVVVAVAAAVVVADHAAL